MGAIVGGHGLNPSIKTNPLINTNPKSNPKGWNYDSTDDTFSYSYGWAAGDKYDAQKQMVPWFREYLKRNGINSEYIDQMSDAELQSIINNNFITKQEDRLGQHRELFDPRLAVDYIQKMEAYEPDKMPEAPDLNQIYQDAQAKSEAEADELYKMYDEILGRQTDNLEQGMTDLSDNFNSYRQQVLSNDYQRNAQLLNTVNTSLSKSRQNALEAGASAGLRLAGNVNTLLSLQNQQASQSLETSNNLAQMLLNQRQAAAGLRNDYANALNQNAMNKANVKSNISDKTRAEAGFQADYQGAAYDRNMQTWEDNRAAALNGNPFASGGIQYYNDNPRPKGGGGIVTGNTLNKPGKPGFNKVSYGY